MAATASSSTSAADSAMSQHVTDTRPIVSLRTLRTNPVYAAASTLQPSHAPPAVSRTSATFCGLTAETCFTRSSRRARDGANAPLGSTTANSRVPAGSACTACASSASATAFVRSAGRSGRSFAVKPSAAGTSLRSRMGHAASFALPARTTAKPARASTSATPSADASGTKPTQTTCPPSAV